MFIEQIDLFLTFKLIVQSKMEILSSFTHSSYYKPVWISFFYWT